LTEPRKALKPGTSLPSPSKNMRIVFLTGAPR
jgi:hypothetical protein